MSGGGGGVDGPVTAARFARACRQIHPDYNKLAAIQTDTTIINTHLIMLPLAFGDDPTTVRSPLSFETPAKGGLRSLILYYFTRHLQ